MRSLNLVQFQQLSKQLTDTQQATITTMLLLAAGTTRTRPMHMLARANRMSATIGRIAGAVGTPDLVQFYEQLQVMIRVELIGRRTRPRAA